MLIDVATVEGDEEFDDGADDEDFEEEEDDEDSDCLTATSLERGSRVVVAAEVVVIPMSLVFRVEAAGTEMNARTPCSLLDKNSNTRIPTVITTPPQPR